jgi:DNA-binding transcriptional LysR family regulator
MNLNLRQLEAFVLLARLGGFSRAADQLHLTQAGVSILIRRLEERLDTRLVERTTRSVALTPAGNQVLPIAERMLADAQSVLACGRGMAADQAGRISLGLAPQLAGTVLPEVLKAFRDDYPRVSVIFRECVNEEIIGRIYAREIDFGLGFGIQKNSELDSQPLTEDTLAVALPPGHPLARKRVLRWKDILNQPIITLTVGSTVRTLTENVFLAAGQALRPAYEATNTITALALAREDLGIAIVPTSIRPAATAHAMELKPLRDPVVRRSLNLITRRGSILSDPGQRFIELFTTAVAQIDTHRGNGRKMPERARQASGDMKRP